MELTSKQLEDYKIRCVSFLHVTQECLPILCETGKLIQAEYKGKETPRYMVFCFDMLKRIRENLLFLTKSDPPQEHNSVPLRLILRSVFSDLISLCYAVENFNHPDILNTYLHYNDLKAVEGKRTFAECKAEFLTLCGKADWTGFFENKIDDFIQVKDEIIAPYGSKGNLKKEGNAEITNIATYFRSKENLKPLYSLLFGPFKMLSQVEHYANENRSYSYFDSNTAFFFHKFSLQYQQVINSVCKDVANHIRDNKSC